MSYEPDKVHRTLILHKRFIHGQRVYSLGTHMLITDATGHNYLEQVPYEGLMDSSRDVYLFNELMIIDAPAPRTDEFANMHDLSCYIGDNFAVRNKA